MLVSPRHGREATGGEAVGLLVGCEMKTGAVAETTGCEWQTVRETVGGICSGAAVRMDGAEGIAVDTIAGVWGGE